jgi:hypothetical protein
MRDIRSKIYAETYDMGFEECWFSHKSGWIKAYRTALKFLNTFSTKNRILYDSQAYKTRLKSVVRLYRTAVIGIVQDF